MNWVNAKSQYTTVDTVQLAKVPFASMVVLLNTETRSIGLYSEKYPTLELEALGDLLATSLDGEDVIQFLQRVFKEWNFQASYLNFNAN